MQWLKTLEDLIQESGPQFGNGRHWTHGSYQIYAKQLTNGNHEYSHYNNK